MSGQKTLDQFFKDFSSQNWIDLVGEQSTLKEEALSLILLTGDGGIGKTTALRQIAESRLPGIQDLGKFMMKATLLPCPNVLSTSRLPLCAAAIL